MADYTNVTVPVHQVYEATATTVLAAAKSLQGILNPEFDRIIASGEESDTISDEVAAQIGVVVDSLLSELDLSRKEALAQVLIVLTGENILREAFEQTQSPFGGLLDGLLRGAPKHVHAADPEVPEGFRVLDLSGLADILRSRG